jgi:DNA-binding Lrp family transcriptional regulator
MPWVELLATNLNLGLTAHYMEDLLGAENLSVGYQSDSMDLLRRLGLTTNQVRVYDLLRRDGSITIGELARRSRLQRASAYRTVDRLKDIGLIELLLGKVARIRALGLDEVLDILISRQEEELKRIRTRSKTQLGTPRELPDYPIAPIASPQKIFARLLVGRHLYSQQAKLIQESREQVVQVMSARGFLIAVDSGLIRSMANKAKRDRVRVRIVAETEGRVGTVPRGIPDELEIRHHANTSMMLRYFIVDRNHLILKMAAPPKVLDQSVALWSNSPDLIQGLYYEFEKLWSESY